MEKNTRNSMIHLIFYYIYKLGLFLTQLGWRANLLNPKIKQ